MPSVLIRDEGGGRGLTGRSDSDHHQRGGQSGVPERTSAVTPTDGCQSDHADGMGEVDLDTQPQHRRSRVARREPCLGKLPDTEHPHDPSSSRSERATHQPRDHNIRSDQANHSCGSPDRTQQPECIHDRLSVAMWWRWGAPVMARLGVWRGERRSRAVVRGRRLGAHCREAVVERHRTPR